MPEMTSTKVATGVATATNAPERTAPPAPDPVAGSRARAVPRRSRVAEIARAVALVALLALGLALLILGMVPQTKWQDLGYSAAGPLPSALAPLTTVLFYAVPALIGLLCRRWQTALVLATLPAFLDLGIFTLAIAGQLGPFYLVQSHPDGTVGTLELYAALGLAGWLVATGAAWLIRMAHSRRV